MKITIFLVLSLAAIYVAQAEPLSEEDAQGHLLEQEQDTGKAFHELKRQKRANCSIDRCSAICKTRGHSGLCRKGQCKCY